MIVLSALHHNQVISSDQHQPQFPSDEEFGLKEQYLIRWVWLKEKERQLPEIKYIPPTLKI